MVSAKDRRNSGRVIVSTEDGYDYYWDNWNDWRDCMRSPFDNTKVRDENCAFNESLEVKKYNEKNKRLCQRRKRMKETRK